MACEPSEESYPSAQSDPGHHCPLEENFYPKLYIKRTAYALIRLRMFNADLSLRKAQQSVSFYCQDTAQIKLL